MKNAIWPLLLLLSGCSTVHITSNPPGAAAYGGGRVLLFFPTRMKEQGITPCEFSPSIFYDSVRAQVRWPDGSKSHIAEQVWWWPGQSFRFSFDHPSPQQVIHVEHDNLHRIPETHAQGILTLPPRTWTVENMAIADLTAYTLSAGEAKTLTEKLHSALVDTKYFRILSRSDMKNVLEAQKFSRSNMCDDSQCLVEMGKLLSVSKIVGGSVGKVGNTFSLTLRLVNVETGETQITVARELKAEPDQLLQLIEEAGRELALKYSETRTDI